MIPTIIETSAHVAVKFKLKIPSDIPTKSKEIFIAGNFNGWATSDKNYQFKKERNGTYALKLNLEKGIYEYKIVRGSWTNCEVSKTGESIDNRVLNIHEDTSVNIAVENWADNFKQTTKKSTAASNVHFLNTAFFIPQLNRYRRIWIYLPQDYFSNNRKYPVIYMQDGQNIFDEATSFSGEWAVDEYLNSLPPEKQCIVVAIDNGDNFRMREYNPYTNKRFGKEEGNAYADFLSNTLKPFVDKHYRTLTQAKYSVIAGSSMGGLISFYTELKYPHIFGIGGIFSPSFWIAPKLNSDVKKLSENFNNNGFYFYGGGQEPDSMESNIETMQQQLQNYSTVKTCISIDNAGIHNEVYWRNEFPNFYKWCLNFWSHDVY